MFRQGKSKCEVDKYIFDNFVVFVRTDDEMQEFINYFNNVPEEYDLESYLK
jgi:hypothetical protein